MNASHMNASQMSKCPSATELHELLDSNSSDAGHSAVVAHLDQCTSCQQSLEALAGGGDSSLSQTLHEHQAMLQPDSSSAYWVALEKAEMALTTSSPGTPRPKRDLSLAFLDPPADGSHLGSLVNFNIVRVVGRGGMGVVLHAIDTCLQRDVAIKILDPELSKDDIARSRFCREARAAAQISHENVIAVHQVEEDEAKDIPFLVMELVTGESLEKKIERDGRFSLREIVSIGMQTAAGLAAAHEKGLIHRDIKPANILLEKNGQRVKLTDFGLARAAEDVRLTRSGLVAGTPLYMSPEQAIGEDLDARSDLFSLGIVLYELAAGEPPFTGNTPLAVLKRLTEEQPRPLRERNPDLPEWFVHIIEKLLAKKPADRFQSASEVAGILEHFWAMMKSSEVLVCPKKKAASARRAIALGVGAGLVTLLLGVVAFFYFAPQRGLPESKIPTPMHVFKGNSGPLWSMAVSSDGKHLAVGADDGAVKYWDVAAERVLWTAPAHKTPIWAMDLSADGEYFATGSDDGVAKVWRIDTQRDAFVLPKIGGVRAIAFSPDSKYLVTGGRDGSVKVWDFRKQVEIAATAGHASLVAAVAFSPDGKSIASASADKTIKIWDAASGQLQLTLTGHESGVYAIAFSPKDRYLASGSWDHTVRLWDLDSGSQLAKLEGHAQDVWSVAFSSDGSRLASTGEDQMIRIWDVASKKEVHAFRGSEGAILNVRFVSQVDGIIAGAKNGTATMWTLASLGLGR